MKHITILATTGSNLGSIDNPRRAFLTVNESLKDKGKSPLFKIQIAGTTKEIKLNNGIYTIHADAEIKNIKKTDLIIIPAFEGDIKKGVEQNTDLIPWIIQQYKKGAEIASLCVGAFLLASTGLLEGKSCSTHWRAGKEFKKMFPGVNLVTDKIITDEYGIYTSGGAFSSANLILYIIEKYAGREEAIQCSKTFQVDLDRHSQSPFIIFEGQKDHNDIHIKKAQEFIENNVQEKISVDQLASMLSIGRRNLERRFKKATSNSLVEYMQRVKVEAAKMRFERSTDNVNEVMYNVGYNDPKAFRSTFKRFTGLSPVSYRNKYNRELATI
ncbi:MAG TPA: helix-turn-helix domain-containing protein [Hanamia sp.]|nr:helix-turn-helix domain-containing protein [Hanamia sp.]